MKIVYLEMDYHAADLVSFAYMCHRIHTVDFLVSESIYTQVHKHLESMEGIHILVKPASMPLSTFMERQKPILDSCDLFVIATIGSQYASYFRRWSPATTWLRIHNAHAWLCPASHWHIEASVFFVRKWVYYVWTHGIKQGFWKYRKGILDQMDALCFPEHSITQYAKTNFTQYASKIAGTLPLAVYIESPKSQSITADIPTLCVPGLIDKRKKEYLPLVDAVRRLKYECDFPLRIVLLGKPVGKYGTHVQHALVEASKGSNIQIVLFKEYIPSDEFHAQLMQADALLGCIRSTLWYGVQQEYPCRTKTSGSLADMIRFAKPIFIPSYIQVEEALQPYAHSYPDSNSLMHLLRSLAMNVEYFREQRMLLRQVLKDLYSPEALCKAVFTSTSRI